MNKNYKESELKREAKENYILYFVFTIICELFGHYILIKPLFNNDYILIEIFAGLVIILFEIIEFLITMDEIEKVEELD